MKKLLLIFTILTMVLCCVSCGPKITKGEIVNKEYLEACTKYDEHFYTTCAGKVFIAHHDYLMIDYPERYTIHIKNEKDGGDTVEIFYVTKEVFEQYQIGDWFEYDETRGDTYVEPCIESEISEDLYKKLTKGE